MNTRAQLSYHDDRGEIRVFDPGKPSFTVGSGAGCDLEIAGLESGECRIYRTPDGYYAEDLGGMLTLNDRPGSGVLHDDDVICLGGWLCLRFNLEAQVLPERPPPGLPPPPPIVPGARPHHPGLALGLGLLLPGAGQAYNGQPVKGVLILLLSVLVVPWLVGLWDAHRVAQRLVAAGGRSGRGGLGWVVMHGWMTANVALGVLIALTLRGVLS